MREARHRIEVSLPKYGPMSMAGKYGPDEFSGGSTCTQTMNAIRYLLAKYRHELDEPPLDLKRKCGHPFKLDMAKIRAIHQMIQDGVHVQDIAAKMGVGQSTVYRVKNHEYRLDGEFPRRTKQSISGGRDRTTQRQLPVLPTGRGRGLPEDAGWSPAVET